MKYLIIGLGSMGRRRIRCLNALGIESDKIFGYDKNKLRLQSVCKEYNINKLDEEPYKAISSFERVIISTSPESHLNYIKDAIHNNKPCFVEASICHARELRRILNSKPNLIVVPSSTMLYFKAQKKIQELISKQKIGNILYGRYHVGQWLENWHPWEDIDNFYVSNPETGGCKEIVPFELNWITKIFGKPSLINSLNTKVSLLKAPIDDVFTINLSFDRCRVFSLIIEILSKPTATRELLLIGDEGKLSFRNDQIVLETIHEKCLYDVSESITPEKDYIYSDKPYIDEINDFISVCNHNDTKLFPHSLEQDIQLLEFLELIEKNNSLA